MLTRVERDLFSGKWFHAGPRQPQAPSELALELWPAANRYCSPLNPIFLWAGPKRLADLNHQPAWWIRDGLVPLLQFFNLHPLPRGVGFRLFISDRFRPWVPKAWRSRVSLYSIVEDAQAAYFGGTRPSSCRKLLLAGLPVEWYCSIEALGRILEHLPSFEEVLLYLPSRPYQSARLAREADRNFQLDFHQTICRSLGTRIKPVSCQGFERLTDLRDYALVELNERLLCEDTYFLHSALSRGARLAVTPRSPSRGRWVKGKLVRLSPYHAAWVHDHWGRKSQTAAGVWADPELSAANFQFLWSRWLPS